MALASGMGTMMREPVALAVSRALGDRDFKIPDKIVIATPFVATYELVESDTHFVLCCDGLTDVLAPQEIIDKTRNADNPKSASSLIVQEAFQRGSDDNLTAIVALLEWPAEREERIKKLRVEKFKLSQILLKHAECMVPIDRVRGVKVERSKEEAVKMATELKTEMEKIKDKANAFADAAKLKSESPEAVKGGELGWVEAKHLQPEVAKAAFGLAVGGISDPIASNSGIHLMFRTE
jgi:parvulin-like peptidyl-prolyl isomerase